MRDDVISGMEQEKAQLEQQITVLNEEIDSLNENIQILSETVAQKVQNELVLSEQLSEQYMPTKVPISSEYNFNFCAY